MECATKARPVPVAYVHRSACHTRGTERCGPRLAPLRVRIRSVRKAARTSVDCTSRGRSARLVSVFASRQDGCGKGRRLGGAPSCAGCHTPPMFLTSAPAGPFSFPDPTDAGINGQNRFKSGSLRNIALTGPYFHNGAVSTLTAMLNGGPPGSPTHVPAHSVNPTDATRLLAFLNTLTDNTVLTEAKFSDPFK